MTNEGRHRYEYEVNPQGHSAAANVLRLVGNGRRVLEVGAGPGSITRALKDTNGCRVTAIEIDDSAIARLKGLCERVYKTDLNADDWPDALRDEPRFDAVVAADVLEHLYAPWKTLALMKTLVSPEGSIVVSLPHAGHFGIVASLLHENFEYADWGLLDRTHIRFFGIRNIMSLFDQAGLKIVDAGFVIRPPEQTEFASLWSALPAGLREALRQANPFGSVYQVVVKAVHASHPAPRMDLMSLTHGASLEAPPLGVLETAKALMRSHLNPRLIAKVRAFAWRLRWK